MFKAISSLTGKMSAIDRYSQTRLINPESVLEHTGWVVMCSYMIGIRLRESGESIDMGVLLAKAAIHDVEEVITGDIASPTKYHNKEITKEIQRLEHSSASKVLMPFPSIAFTTWSVAKQGKEGFIVMLADKLAVAYKVNQEVSHFGNQTIKGHIDGLVPSLKDIEQYMGDNDVIQNQQIIHKIIDEALETCQTLI